MSDLLRPDQVPDAFVRVLAERENIGDLVDAIEKAGDRIERAAREAATLVGVPPMWDSDEENAAFWSRVAEAQTPLPDWARLDAVEARMGAISDRLARLADRLEAAAGGRDV